MLLSVPVQTPAVLMTFKLNIADGIQDHEGSEMEFLLITERDYLLRLCSDLQPMASVPSVICLPVSLMCQNIFPSVQTPWPVTLAQHRVLYNSSRGWELWMFIPSPSLGCVPSFCFLVAGLEVNHSLVRARQELHR